MRRNQVVFRQRVCAAPLSMLSVRQVWPPVCDRLREYLCVSRQPGRCDVLQSLSLLKEFTMRFTLPLRSLSLNLALISFLSAGAASAQSLSGVNATLEHNLDTRRAAAGQTVTARLDGSVKTAEGVTLPRGTELVGKIDEVKNSKDGGPASVSLVFSTARLKDGKEIPVKVTVVAAYPATAGNDASDDDPTMPPVPNEIKGDTSIDQAPGALSRVALTSAVRNSDSATFSRTNGDFRLEAGTYLQLGIAPANAASQSAAAE